MAEVQRKQVLVGDFADGFLNEQGDETGTWKLGKVDEEIVDRDCRGVV